MALPRRLEDEATERFPEILQVSVREDLLGHIGEADRVAGEVSAILLEVGGLARKVVDGALTDKLTRGFCFSVRPAAETEREAPINAILKLSACALAQESERAGDLSRQSGTRLFCEVGGKWTEPAQPSTSVPAGKQRAC